MTNFQIHQLSDASVLAIEDMRPQIFINPEYQRPGGVWNQTQRQLFIDSLLNRYDIPKLYFHQIDRSQESTNHRYAIVDGRQRLETIWDFVDGKFALAADFEYYGDSEVKAGGMTYEELSQEYPKLVTRLNSRTLTIMVVAADELDLVEDMFTRLNEATPLNAAEKRNAFSGPLPVITRRLAQHGFFVNRVRVSSTRYRHHDVVVKLMYLEHNPDMVDTKKASLDSFFIDAKKQGMTECQFFDLESTVAANLDTMYEVFVDSDELLRSSGMIVVYYVLFSRLRREGTVVTLGRSRLLEFEDIRKEKRHRFEHDLEGVDYRLIEFDELARSSNDAAAIRERYGTLRKHIGL